MGADPPRVTRAFLALSVVAAACWGGGPSAGEAPSMVAPTTSPAHSAPPPGTEPAPTLAPSEPFGRGEVVLTDGSRRIRIPVYVAATAAARRRGLMGRGHLRQDAGMVFLFPQDHATGFWMKDTRIPLSIAFIRDDGMIVDIQDMDPCGQEPCPTYAPGVTYRHALEVNQGYFDRQGVEPGWRAGLPAASPG